MPKEKTAPDGRDPIIGVRVPPELRSKIEAWGQARTPPLGLSAAVRELLQIALKGKK